MTTEGNESMELDCYEAVEAVSHHKNEVIHLGMDVQEIEGGQTYWNVYVPTKWDNGQRLVLLSQEEFKAIANVLLLEALAVPDYSVLSRTDANTVNNLVAPMGKFHLDEPLHQCPECSTVLDRAGETHFRCSKCKTTMDNELEIAQAYEDYGGPNHSNHDDYQE